MKRIYEAYQNAQADLVTQYMDKYNALLRNLDGITKTSSTVRGAEDAVNWMDNESGKLEQLLKTMPKRLGNVKSLIKGEIDKQKKHHSRVIANSNMDSPSKRETVEAVVNEYEGNYYIILPMKAADVKQDNETINFIYKHCFDALKDMGIRPKVTSFNGYLTIQTRHSIGFEEASMLDVKTQYINFKVATGFYFKMPPTASKKVKRRPADPKDPTKKHLRELFLKGWNVQNVMAQYPNLPEWHLRGIKAHVTRSIQNGKPGR